MKERIRENLSYKIISLLIAAILWMTLLARKEYIHSISMDVDFLTDAQMHVTSHDGGQVRLKISGDKSHLRTFTDSLKQKHLLIDLKGKEPGFYNLEIPVNQVPLPEGVRLLGVRPSQIQINLSKSKKD